MQGKQTKMLNAKQEAALLRHLETTRYPLRDTVMFLLSVKAGLRAQDIAALTWSMITDAEGQVGDTLPLENRATKGRTGGRSIPLHPQLHAALTALHQARAPELEPWHPVLFSERGRGLTADTVQLWLHRLYTSLGFAGVPPIPDAAPSSPAPPARSRKPEAPGATGSSSPGTPAWP
jgi:integrase/recombinase XerC